MLAPTTVVCSSLLDTAAPAGTVTEAFAVTVMAIVVGTAIGNAVGGAIVDAATYRSAALAAAGIAVARGRGRVDAAANAAALRARRYAASRRSLDELLGDAVLEARVEDEQDLVAVVDHRVGLRARSPCRRAGSR